MGDSTNIAAIPLTVNIAAAYATGHLGVVTQQQMDARFPPAKYGHCSIDVTGAAPWASVRDWENGDKGGSLEQWVIDHNKASGRKDAVVYCNRATIPEVRQLTGSQILNRDYFLWVATLDGTVYGPGQLAGVVACQIKGQNLTGGDYDLSLVYSDTLWLPVVPPKPAPPKVTQAQAKAAIASAMTALATLTVAIPELPN